MGWVHQAAEGYGSGRLAGVSWPSKRRKEKLPVQARLALASDCSLEFRLSARMRADNIATLCEPNHWLCACFLSPKQLGWSEIVMLCILGVELCCIADRRNPPNINRKSTASAHGDHCFQ